MYSSKWSLSILIVIFFGISMFAQEKADTPAVKKHAFVGTETCGMCHRSEKQGKQLDIWKASKHASAYKTLLTDTANAIAKARGLKNPAVKEQACLKCHVVGNDVDASLIGKKFKVEDGVQCETCHGAGADFKDAKIMKNKDEAIKNGLVLPQDKTAFCTKCHNSESPTYQEFKTEEFWNKIKHDIPKETK